MMPRRRYAGREGQAPEGLRSLRSLRPLPSSSASSLRDNLLPKGPSPCPCPGVDTPSGPGLPALLPTMAIIPPGQNAGMVIWMSLRQEGVADECRCGGRLWRMNVYAAGCCCCRSSLWRGQGATPAAFYLGLCRLRGILSPPAPHDCAAGGPFFFAAAKIRIGHGRSLSRRSLQAGHSSLRNKDWNRTRTSLIIRILHAKPCIDSQVWA